MVRRLRILCAFGQEGRNKGLRVDAGARPVAALSKRCAHVDGGGFEALRHLCVALRDRGEHRHTL